MTSATLPETIHSILKQYWGYDGFLPLQTEAIEAIQRNQDSLVVMPTGSGKSLCFQLPVVMMPGTAIVVSPLVALMKDQVDGLRSNGIRAGCLNSSLSSEEQDEVWEAFQNKRLDLLYVSPERLAMDGFRGNINPANIAYFVIDEAHCISEWGHDFRDDYRKLNQLKAQFPDKSIHAFTATATETVREDIVSVLKLSNTAILVGNFERPNLFYRVQYRENLLNQVCDIVERHSGEGGIVYCISRKDVDSLTVDLQKKGYKALPYHAGLGNAVRKANQEAFIKEETDIVIATVAFGMGIDRSNVRYVIHTGMPKSVEHYQQEAGRAGRDRMPAECTILYSRGDIAKWRTIFEMNQNGDTAAFDRSLLKLQEISGYCQGVLCRHRFLVEHFGQDFGRAGCTHCDCCLGEFEVHEDSTKIAQIILSCVYHLKERFGGHHVADVLKGRQSEKVMGFWHDQLRTYGLLRDHRKQDILQWIDQLTQQSYLEKEPVHSTIRFTSKGVRFLKEKQDGVMLSKSVRRVRRKERETVGEPQDSSLFEALRKLRRLLAKERNLPPYMVFSDSTLHEIVQYQPRTLAEFREIRGVGDAKLEAFGEAFLKVITESSETNLE